MIIKTLAKPQLSGVVQFVNQPPGHQPDVFIAIGDDLIPFVHSTHCVKRVLGRDEDIGDAEGVQLFGLGQANCESRGIRLENSGDFVPFLFGKDWRIERKGAAGMRIYHSINVERTDRGGIASPSVLSDNEVKSHNFLIIRNAALYCTYVIALSDLALLP